MSSTISTGEKMRVLRKSRGMTLKDIAEKMGVSISYVTKWEKDARRITSEHLKRYCEIMGVTLDYFAEKNPERSLNTALMELSNFFATEGISESDKDKAYQQIMRLYLESKERRD